MFLIRIVNIYSNHETEEYISFDISWISLCNHVLHLVFYFSNQKVNFKPAFPKHHYVIYYAQLKMQSDYALLNDFKFICFSCW